MFFRSARAAFVDTAMPAPTVRRYGFPASGLIGLYLFGEVAAGQPNPGPYVDLSGSGNTAVKAGTRATPTQQGYGLQVTDQYGFYMECPFAQPKSWTAITAVNADAQTGSQSAILLSNSGNGTPTAAADYWAQSPWPFLEVPTGADSPIRGFSVPGDFSDSAAQATLPLSLTSGKRGQWVVPAMSVDGDLGRVRVTARSGEVASATTAKMVTRQAAAAPAKVLLGMMPFVQRFPVTGRVAGFAYYNRALTAEELVVANAAMAAITTARGVALA